MHRRGGRHVGPARAMSVTGAVVIAAATATAGASTRNGPAEIAEASCAERIVFVERRIFSERLFLLFELRVAGLQRRDVGCVGFGLTGPERRRGIVATNSERAEHCLALEHQQRRET